MRVFEQAVEGGDRGVSLARSRRHLDQGTGAVSLERGLRIGDGGFLAIA